MNGGCLLLGLGLGDFNMFWFWLVDYKICEVCFKSLDWFNDLIGDVFFIQYSVNIVANVDEVDNILLDGVLLFVGVWMGYFGDFNKVYCKISLGLGEYIFSSFEFFQVYVYGRGFVDVYIYFVGYIEVEEEEYVCFDIQVEGVFCVDFILQWSC